MEAEGPGPLHLGLISKKSFGTAGWVLMASLWGWDAAAVTQSHSTRWTEDAAHPYWPRPGVWPQDRLTRWSVSWKRLSVPHLVLWPLRYGPALGSLDTGPTVKALSLRVVISSIFLPTAAPPSSIQLAATLLILPGQHFSPSCPCWCLITKERLK